MPETNDSVTTVIESLGVYLPAREVTTDELVRGCRKKVRFPLERMTGIRTRRVAGDAEFAIDLACEAVTKCLALSKYKAGEIDLVISAAIARADGPGFQVSYEPSTALRLKKLFGLDRALAFDVRSACSGMWVGVVISDVLIRAGVIARSLVVSGEYISHVAATAQLEIDEFLDTRMACLTLGDSGAAVLLDGTTSHESGFAAVDLCTFGGYATYCVARPTDQAHGGAIMTTDALKLTEVAGRHGSDHALATLERAGWPYDGFQHLIMHQTSRTALAGAMRAINRRIRRDVCHAGNTINNLEQRGNTATTTHFVALADQIAAGRIRSGDRVIFSVSGGGLTIGTALYTLDDLPERMNGAPAARRSDAASASAPVRAAEQQVGIAAIGTAPRDGTMRDSIGLLGRAATECLRNAGAAHDDIDVLIFAGVYRTHFVNEPAMAALLAGAIGINATSAENGHYTLAFDVMNGGVGVLNACWLGAELIRAGRAKRVLIVAGEVENNADSFRDHLLGVEETASALLLTATGGSSERFGGFHFESFPEHSEAFVSHLTNRGGQAWLRFHRDPALEQLYVSSAAQVVGRFLEAEQIDRTSIRRVFAPQISTGFLTVLAEALAVPRAAVVDVVRAGFDLSTSSFAFALQHARREGVQAGDVGLIVSVGAGIEVGCALYHF